VEEKIITKIIFIDTIGLPKEVYPIPASKEIPDWLKKTESYIGGEKKPNGDAVTTATIKKCMPVFDAITAGYIIPLPADVYVSKKIVDGEETQWFEWANYNLIEFHPFRQASLHPAGNSYPFPKFANPWGVKTPRGYSSLFVQPFHRDAPFTIFPGIVDTDTYTTPVNFPMTINDLTFEGLIAKGTPMVQVIPFKRDSWEISFGKEKELQDQREQKLMLKSKFFDKYKNMFWVKKDYL